MRKIIGVVAPYISQEFLAAIMDQIHALARERNAEVMMFEGNSEEIGPSTVAQERVDGWILFLNSAGAPDFLKSGKPVIAMSSTGCEELCPVILPDNWGGIQAIMQHLFEHGHKHIAFIGTMDNGDIQQRYQSYLAALTNSGLTPDPALVADTIGYREDHGRAAVQSLLDAGQKFTALVTGGDFNAFGAIRALRAAGYRVPEDIAVTGFDDVSDAQYADPPLTTVRQRPEALGKLAAETLLRMMDGETFPLASLFAPTAPIWRRSCGCERTSGLPMGDPDKLGDKGWQDYLIQQMALLAQHPLPLDPGADPALIWPGSVRLVEELAATLHGTPAANTADLEQPWRDPAVQTDNVDVLHAILKVYKTAAQQQLARLAPEEAVARQVEELLERNALAMTRVCINRESVSSDVFFWNSYMSYVIDGAMLDETSNSALSLDWLQHTLAEWACLGLWDTDDAREQKMLTIAAVYQRTPQVNIKLGSRIPASQFPPLELQHSPIASGKITNTVMLPIATSNRQLGYIAMRLPTEKQLTYDLNGLRVVGARLAARLERERLLDSLRAQQQTLSQAYERERSLAETIREIGCPVIPLLDRVLLVPLIGVIDADRAQQMLQVVLDGISRYQAEFILLDITGVPLVDTQVANSLLQTAQASQLLGARVVLVGVRPEIAQSIVGLGMELRQVATFQTLAAALSSLQSLPARTERVTIRLR